MKRACRILAVLSLFPCALPAAVVDDTFSDGDSQNQDLPNNSLWLFNGRSNNIRTDQPGSVTFDVTPATTSSEAVWAYFTPTASPIVLGSGDSLSVSITFSLSGFRNNGQDIRFGVLNSLGTRNTTNLTGGMNDATFIGDPGYGLDFYASGTGSPFAIGRRTILTNANVFNDFGDFAPVSGSGANERQPLLDNTSYTLTYNIARISETTTSLSASVTGGNLSGLNFAAIENNSAPNSAFDYFAFRIGGTNFTNKITFTRLLIQYTPAAPFITTQPQPSNLTVQTGSAVTLAVGAGGSDLNHQWRKDGLPISGNASAVTATLTLANIQHADAGIYTALVSNAGGSVASDPVTLGVSDTPVPPPPIITVPPANATVTLGETARFSVTAAGNNLLYQWFKNGIPIPGATGAQLTIPNARPADSDDYSVVVGNSSGSVRSSSAALTVVSPMSAIRFAPANRATGICGDTPLSIQFDQTPLVGTTGQISIYNSLGKVVDAIDLAANPQTRVIGGIPFSYLPVIVTGNTASIYPHQPLPANDFYAIKLDPGVLIDASGAPYAGFTSPNVWTFKTKAGGPLAGTAALTVATDGSGDFCSVQGAIDFVPPNNAHPVAITVRPGTYREIVYVPSNKPFITVRGADRDGSVIQYSNNNNLNPSTTGRPVFGVDAPDFTLENVTVWNTTPHLGSQAEAFRGNGKRILLNRVTLRSYQDTLLLQGTGFVTDSYIEGDVDFMWGTGAVFFRNSELKALTSGGYYTQIRNPQGEYGNVYVNCRLTGAPGVTGMYLSRIDPAVFPFSQAVYIDTTMGDHVSPAGWLLNNVPTAPNVQFLEYNSTDPNGAPVDVSHRLQDSRQLTAAEAAQWRDPAFVLGGWVPFTVNAVRSKTGEIAVDWSAAPGHSSKDRIGLYAAGDPDASFLAAQFTGEATTGHLTFNAPTKAGSYEFRYLLSDGIAKVATGNGIVVR